MEVVRSSRKFGRDVNVRIRASNTHAASGTRVDGFSSSSIRLLGPCGRGSSGGDFFRITDGQHDTLTFLKRLRHFEETKFTRFHGDGSIFIVAKSDDISGSFEKTNSVAKARIGARRTRPRRVAFTGSSVGFVIVALGCV